ncbi:SigE family RNA polymerase sigma factor [Nocardioides sp. TF02-7]|uniref:SigE family RNA polymerase sigma factor n=1 Tax=Nocardioides sp. TF02-7 TaxID=2917724 RepID=UPI001F05EB46|nr:SigE family RNA polymerase sigma factor [Nocardioides sp. TF02-7]UMG92909.1 SigE family RNA polymerase sigma factor [Nocardioides sp. TF02-7]
MSDAQRGTRDEARQETASADAAVEQLYLAHWDQLVRLSVLLVRDQGTAEEIVQDALVAVHQRWDRLTDHGKALAYLRQAVVNRSRSALRHRGVVNRYLARQAAPGHLPGADEPVLGESRRRMVLDALQRLPRRQREVLALRYYLELSEAEIAETLGISRGAVKSHASRGAATLRPMLEELGPDLRSD